MYPPLVQKIRLVLYAVGLLAVVAAGTLKHQATGWRVLYVVIGALCFITVFLIGSLARAARKHNAEQALLAQRDQRRSKQKRKT